MFRVKIHFFISVFVCLACIYADASLASDLEKAQKALEGGRIEAAHQAYLELQVAHGEDPRVIFGLACAHYARGEAALDRQAHSEVSSSFATAKRLFKDVFEKEAPAFLEDTQYNALNCDLQLTLLELNQLSYQDQLRALRECEAEFTAFLEGYPTHASALRNRDRLRYEIKRLLQQPPETAQEPPPDQSTEGGGGFKRVSTEIPGASVEKGDQGRSVRLLLPGQGGDQ